MPIIQKKISISVVSHMQANMVLLLLSDLEQHCKSHVLEVLLTSNLPEDFKLNAEDYSFPVVLHVNQEPLGFSANHNQAFIRSAGSIFCVVNPDIRLDTNPFQAMLAYFDDSAVGLVAPLVLRPSGEMEDSARYFPSPLKIVCKAVGRCKGADYPINDQPVSPDWVAGMFMLFPRDIFTKLGGFDQRYFLYYEDVDLCARMRLLGNKIVLCPQAQVIHYAQRSSHRSLKYFRWHLFSMMRFFFSTVYWRLLWRKCF